MSDVISLNDQINLCSLGAAEQLLLQIDSGAISPTQAQIFASILITAFNPIAQSSDFLKLITEVSEYASSLPQPIERQTYVLYRASELLTVTRTATTVSTSGASIKKWSFDTEEEAQNRVIDLIKLTQSKGFRLRK